ncbi:iron-sulfur cluster insertion protein ErpA [Limibacillus halophilus]|uniref:Iron-sulfur cluster insertion protein n=1 Tax=Limibacillus halophilus TaxID=1579333 RepID=A0A839SX72_9PROT|nr:iron-sulfur cluster insertion protein [Limibacillus halophilus]
MSEMTTIQRATQSLSLTENAAKRIAWLMQQEEQSNLMLRIAVSGGGCSGFQYGFSFDDNTNPDDVTFERDGARVVIDQMSLELLSGSQVDFVEDLMGAYFKIENPNATASCGCGTSFAI